MKTLVINIKNPTFKAGEEMLKDIIKRKCARYFSIPEAEAIFGSPRFAGCFIFEDIFAVGEDEIPSIYPSARAEWVLGKEKTRDIVSRLADYIVKEELGDVEVIGL